MSTRRESNIRSSRTTRHPISACPATRISLSIERHNPTHSAMCPIHKARPLSDKGLGNFLRSPENADEAWKQLAPQFDGRFRVATVRNVDKRPRPDFVKAYMHNGYFKSLKEVVHFYNTRDTLPKCEAGSPAEKVSCWPPPENATNINTNCCDLGLSDDQEDDVVAFLKTLTDGYTAPLGSPPSSAAPPAARDN